MSTSIGNKGTTIKTWSKGTYVTTSIPGTGLYSRKKISNFAEKNVNNENMVNQNPPTSSNNSNCGCIIMIAIIVIAIIVIVFSGIPADMRQFVWYAAVILICLVGIISKIVDDNHKEELQKYNYEYKYTTGLFERVLNQIKKVEKDLLEKCEYEIKQAKDQLAISKSETESLFLKSFIKHHKYNTIGQFYELCLFKPNQTKIDSLFTVIALASTNKDAIRTAFRRQDISVEQRINITRQLLECGITDYYLNYSNPDFLLSSQEIHGILEWIRNNNYCSPLNEEYKSRINLYIKERYKDLFNEDISESHIPEYDNITDDTELLEKFNLLCQDFTLMSSSEGIWEIISQSTNTVAKSSANITIDRKRIYDCGYDIFNHMAPEAMYIHFYDRKKELYIYPQYIIYAQDSLNFQIFPISENSIKFKRSRFIEEEITPKDSKIIGHTSKFVNKDGKPDARFANNPILTIYEYGEIAFTNIDLIIQVSNVDAAEKFFQSFLIYQGKKPSYTKEKPNIINLEEDFNITDNSQDNKNISGRFSIAYFNDACSIAKSLINFANDLRKEQSFSLVLNSITAGKIEPKDNMPFFLAYDFSKCYKHLGHDIKDLNTKEGLPIVLILGELLNSNTKFTYEHICHPQFADVVKAIENFVSEVDSLELKFDVDELILSKMLAAYDPEIHTKYSTLLYRLFSIIAKVDGKITTEESFWLSHLMNLTKQEKKDSISKEQTNVTEINKDVKKQPSNEEPMKKLNSLIGLQGVKNEITQLANFVKIQKEREKNGLKTLGLSYHCVFTGNPGTGKTTVARIVAEIYRDLGIIKKGHLIETDCSGLVAGYVGQTAIKTNNIIDSALDGVLFIDEAYSLIQGSNSDFGTEAISTLLKRMEDDRDRLIVILAGYSNEMKQFIDSNPGLQSRFSRYIHFEDYNADELKQIFLLQAKSNQYEVSKDAEKILEELLEESVNNKDKNFGNGRFVRNVFEATLQKQATRLAALPSTNIEQLSLITPEDISK